VEVIRILKRHAVENTVKAINVAPYTGDRGASSRSPALESHEAILAERALLVQIDLTIRHTTRDNE
jgi:hypothetical protein